MWEGDSDTVLQKAELLRLKMINGLTKIHNPLGNPYIHYYLGQQDGHGMPVLRGSSWQKGYGQVGYGLGGLFRSLGKIAKPMIKSGNETLPSLAASIYWAMSLLVKASNKQQEPLLWKA